MDGPVTNTARQRVGRVGGEVSVGRLVPAVVPLVTAAMAAVATDLLINALVDWLTPSEYDGRAYVSLPEADPRLRISALLRWEVDNVAAGLQTLSEHGLQPIRSFFVPSTARDKAARLVQYTLRLVMGVLARLPPSKARLHCTKTLGTIVLSLANARRTLRLFELGPFAAVLSAGGAAPAASSRAIACRLLLLCGRWAVACFHSLDRGRWLQDHGLLGGDARRTGRLSMRCLALAHACRAMRELLDAFATADLHSTLDVLREAKRGCDLDRGASLDVRLGGREDREAALASLREAFKQMLCLLQAAHYGRVPLLRTNDIAVGTMGVLTTLDDLRILWEASRKRPG